MTKKSDSYKAYREAAETNLRITRKRQQGKPLIATSARTEISSAVILDVAVKTLTEQPRNAAYKRHEKDKMVRAEAIRLFRQRDWKSTRQAAKTILADVQRHATSVEANILKTDRAFQTLYEWLLEEEKK